MNNIRTTMMLLSVGIMMVSGGVFAGYTSYSSNTGYTQPYTGYVPYYHSNRDYLYEGDELHNAEYVEYGDVGDYYSDDDVWNYDVRYDVDSHYVDNSITHSDIYNIVAEYVDIDNSHYYGNYGPYKSMYSYPKQPIFDQLPAEEECQTRTHAPREDDFFEDLGTRIPTEVSRIQKYRVKRSDGDRSMRYIPGVNDIEDDRDTRMRAHFGHYQHQVTYCDYRVAKEYKQYNHYYYPPVQRGYVHSAYARGYQQKYWNVIDEEYAKSTGTKSQSRINRIHITIPSYVK